MFERTFEVPEEKKSVSHLTLRDVATILFRQRIWVAVMFAAVMLLFYVAGFLSPSYEAETQVLVRLDRSDPMVSSQENAPPGMGRGNVTEEDLNSEVELIRTPDLLRKVVLALSLQDKEHVGGFNSGDPTQIRIAKAMKHMAARLTVKPLQKTDIVSVRYQAADPQTAQKVLETLNQLYLDKNMQVHRPTGEFELFANETARYQQNLIAAEEQLRSFTTRTGISAPQVQRDLTLKNLADSQEMMTQARVSIAETEHRIHELERLKTSVSERRTTALKTGDNPQLLQQMKSRLLDLELKNSEMLAKFAPEYKPVQDLEKQIVETKATIAHEVEFPVREQTTDSNPTHEWVESELAKAHADLAGLKARETATQGAIGDLQSSAQQLQQNDIAQSDLTRNVKAQEESYLLYVKKREEARINEVLDRGKILNVAIAEPPLLPVFPTRPMSMSLLLALVVAAIMSAVAGYGIDMMDGSFRTPHEISKYLDVPVLAFVPKRAAGE